MLMDNPWVVALIVGALCVSSSVGALVTWFVVRGWVTNLMRLLDRSQKHVIALSEKPGAMQMAIAELAGSPEVGDDLMRDRLNGLRLVPPDEYLAGEG